MIPAHDRVRLTDRERAEFDRLGRDMAAPATGPTPAALVTAGLLVLVVGVLTGPAVLVGGIGLALSGLGRALVRSVRVDSYFDQT